MYFFHYSTPTFLALWQVSIHEWGGGVKPLNKADRAPHISVNVKLRGAQLAVSRWLHSNLQQE